MRSALFFIAVSGVVVTPLFVGYVLRWQEKSALREQAIDVLAYDAPNFEDTNVYWNDGEIISNAPIPSGIDFEQTSRPPVPVSDEIAPTDVITPTYTLSQNSPSTPEVRISSSERKKQVENIPIRVIISKINLNAPIIVEGRTPEGLMDVPADNATVGWWKYGKVPGEFGSAVLAGHYKVADGSPGVFYKLNEVQIGDEIQVISGQNNIQTFLVQDRHIYTEPGFPTKFVYATKDAKRLNLITCSGDYLPDKDDYSHRLVVYAVLKE